MAVKTTDAASHTPKNIKPPRGKERRFMTKAEAIEDNEKIRERLARQREAGKAFDREEAEKKAEKKAPKPVAKTVKKDKK